MRRETGKEQMVQVHHDEGIAIHIDPESCAVVCEDISEALTGECTGQPLNRERPLNPGADVVPLTEGNTTGRDIASVQMARRGRRPWQVQHSSRGNREISRSTAWQSPPVRIGKVRSRSR